MRGARRRRFIAAFTVAIAGLIPLAQPASAAAPSNDTQAVGG